MVIDFLSVVEDKSFGSKVGLGRIFVEGVSPLLKWSSAESRSG